MVLFIKMTETPLEKRTDEEYLRILREEYGWEVEGPSYTEVPEPNPENIKGYESTVNCLKHYLLSTYIIKDQFGKDHDARRDIRAEIYNKEKELHDWLDKHSKLRATILSGVVLAVQRIIGHLKRANHPLYRDVSKIIFPEIAPYSYHTLDDDQKIALSKEMDKAAYQMLEVLSK